MIDQIPVVCYGEAYDRCFLYIHEKMGFKEEAEFFAEIACWCVVPELKTVLRYMQQHFKTIGLRANSIGAWFAMQSFDGPEFEQCLFVSPVLDMEKLIQNMMLWAGVAEERLRGLKSRE